MPLIYPLQRPKLPLRRNIQKNLSSLFKQLKINAKLILLLILAIVSVIALQNMIWRQQVASINKKPFGLRIADSNQERQAGLSNSPKLRENEAMLFVFDSPGKHCFWMKDMSYPIDILWFDSSKKLIHVAHAVGPETYPENFCPAKSASYVLEVNSGVAGEMKIKIGDQIVLPKL